MKPVQVSSVLLIYYAGANKGKFEEILPYIKKRLSLRYTVVDAVAGKGEKQSENLAFENASKYDIIVACGGDGTLHQVVNGIAKSGAKPLIGVLPYGTCNDVARTLKIPKETDKAIDCLLRLNTIKYDLMFDGNEYLTYSLAAGYVTPVSFAASGKLKKVFGRFAYFLLAIKYIFASKSMPLTVSYNGKVFDGKAPFIMLQTGHSVAGFNINKEDDLNNGKFNMIILKGNKFTNFFRLIKMFLFGVKTIKKSKATIVENCSEVEIRNHSNAVFAMDGEKYNFLKKQISVPKTVTFITK